MERGFVNCHALLFVWHYQFEVCCVFVMFSLWLRNVYNFYNLNDDVNVIAYFMVWIFHWSSCVCSLWLNDDTIVFVPTLLASLCIENAPLFVQYTVHWSHHKCFKKFNTTHNNGRKRLFWWWSIGYSIRESIKIRFVAFLPEKLYTINGSNGTQYKPSSITAWLMKWRKLKKKIVENLHDITKHALHCIQLHQLFDQIVCYLSILFILHRKILSFVSNKCKFHVLRENVHPTDLMSLPKLESEKRNNTQHIDRCHLNLFLVHFALQNTEKAQRTQHFENSFSMFFFFLFGLLFGILFA